VLARSERTLVEPWHSPARDDLVLEKLAERHLSRANSPPARRARRMNEDLQSREVDLAGDFGGQRRSCAVPITIYRFLLVNGGHALA